MCYNQSVIDILTLPLWEDVWFGNTVRQYVVALLYFAGLFLIFKALQKILILRLKQLTQHTQTDVDDAFIRIVQTVRPSVYLVLAIYLALRVVIVPPAVRHVLTSVFIVVLVYQLTVAIQILVDYLIHRRVSQTTDQSAQAVLRFINQIIRIGLWVVGSLFVLSNIGINVTSLIAGLGIGGIAVALAAQNVLGDLFSSLAIYFDRPFSIGDFIVVGDIRGTVRHIGIKTTRIKSLRGEEVIIPNHELTSAQIKNFRRLEERRVAFNIDVMYDESLDKLKAIPGIIKNIIASVPHTRFDRVHFYKVSPASLTFRVVFFMTVRDFKKYMDARQEINFKIIEAFTQEKIALALPIGTIKLTK